MRNKKIKDKKKKWKIEQTITNNNKSKLIINITYKNKMKTSYCVKCKKGTENIDRKVVRTKNNRLVM